MKLHRFPLCAAVLSAAVGLSNLNAQTTVATDPVGFVTLSIKGGNPTTTALSIPLLETAAVTGQAVGQITGVGANTITNTNAGWATNGLSAATNPHLIQITSGNATGRMFLVATNPNTATSLTINSTDILQGNLTNLGVSVGDSYKLVPCDTLNTLFGPNASITDPTAAPPAGLGIRGGTTISNADNVILFVNGASRTYFYRTNSTPGWVLSGLVPSLAGNAPLPPYAGIQYVRRATSNISFTVTGSVPTLPRRMMVRNSGSTLISQFWPATSTLAGSNGLNLQTIPGWVANANANNADKVTVVGTNGSQATYYYDGTNWRAQTLLKPISNTAPIAVGSAIQINKLGSSSTFSSFTNNVPYNLQ